MAAGTSGGLAGGGSFKINVVPKGAWESPHGVVFSSPGQVFADNRFPYLDHLRTVLQLQKQAFLTEMCVEEKSGKPPYAMGLDEETFFTTVEIPCMIIFMFLFVVLFTMFVRKVQGKSAIPFGVSCEGYEQAAGGGAGDAAAGGGGWGVGGGAGAGGAGQGGAAPGAWSQPTSGFQPGSSAASGNVAPGTAPGSAAGAESKKDKEALPYERIPTPGVDPYIWSPPPTIFQPSPTPAGTPFVGSAGGAGGPGDDDSPADEYIMRLHASLRSPRSPWM